MDTLIDRDGSEICTLQEDGPAALVDPARLLLPGGRRERVTVMEGSTVADLLRTVPRELWPYVQAYNHGTPIADWENFHFRAGDSILLAVTPQGGDGSGKQIIGAILMIAVTIFAPGWGNALVAGTGLAGYGAAVGIGITMVAGMVISALIAPPTINTNPNVGTSGGPASYSITGQSNAARPYEACPTVYGVYKVMPTLAANPNVDNYANSSQISALYDFGLGYVNVYDLRIGDVPASEYQPALVLHTNDYADDLQLVPARIGYDQYSFVMQQNVPVTVRTKPLTINAALDIQFPRGIFQASQAYGTLPWQADFVAYWRVADTGTWQLVPIDWYLGARAEYPDTKVGISYYIEGDLSFQPVNYNPATSPAELRRLNADWLARQDVDQSPYRDYLAAIPNGWVQWEYPAGAINEADYFARYPEIRQVGWTKSAKDHFESIGSREGRNPGTETNWRSIWPSVQPYRSYDIATSPTALHTLDIQTYGITTVGGASWIFFSGAGIYPQLVAKNAPIAFTIVDPAAWDANRYLARYPDIARAGIDPWDHFSHYGAFEGRDPYPDYNGVVRMSAAFVGVYWMRISCNFPTADTYEIQVTRTDKIDDGTDTTIAALTEGLISTRVNQSVIGLLRSFQWGENVTPRLRHTMLEMRVVATDKLQGVVQNLSAICVGVVPVTSDGVSFWYAETRNPAWIALDILTSEKNPKPLARSQIDWPSWLHLVIVCDTLRSYVVNGAPFTGPRFTCDIVVTATSTVKTLVESVLAGCRASMVLTTSGTWGVLLDEEKTTPRQLITPANSWGFSGSRTFTQQPHALRVNFINAANNAYTKDEVLVYWDGYNAGNATIFETLETYGITDYAHAWAYGRYMMAQGIMRSELFSLSMDVENLLVQRGDLVQVAHDVPRVGGVPDRVVEVNTAPGNGGVRITQELTAMATGYAVRLSDDTVRTGWAYRMEEWGDGWWVLESNAGVQPDDLIVLGDFDRVVFPYLVQRIEPGPDLSAQLTLCKYDPAVYQADQGLLPTWDPGFGHDYINGTDLRSFDLTATQTLIYQDRMPVVVVQLAWTTAGWNLDHHELSYVSPHGDRVPIETHQWAPNYRWAVYPLEQADLFGVPLQIQVLPVNATGYQGVPAYVSITLLPDRSAPPPVPVFGVNVQKETVDLTWQPPDAPDVAGYILKYSPQVEAPNWDASQDLATYDFPIVHGSAGARTGSYGIRVLDTSGNISPVVWRRTTVAFLPEINVITVLNDALLNPEPWPGKKQDAIVIGREVENAGEWGAVVPDAVYYCDYPVDLGDVYEARVSSKIEAYGLTEGDLMVNWVPSLADVTAMSNSAATTALWNAWLEVRVANTMAFMSDWVPSIADIDPIAGATDSAWSSWRACHVGDFTGRIFQFRICMQSRHPGIKAVVRSGRIEVDMPDRIDSYGDVGVPAAGIDFEFPVAFRSLSAVAITIDGNSQPVVANVTNKSPTGFHLTLTNTQTQALTAGQVDIMAQGYGRTGITSI